jgi:hypothetical protein
VFEKNEKKALSSFRAWKEWKRKRTTLCSFCASNKWK